MIKLFYDLIFITHMMRTLDIMIKLLIKECMIIKYNLSESSENKSLSIHNLTQIYMYNNTVINNN